MASEQEREVNQAAYQRLKYEIAEKYPKNRFVAIGRGQIIADTETMDEMLVKTQELGWDPLDVVVVKAGVIVPDYVTII